MNFTKHYDVAFQKPLRHLFQGLLSFLLINLITACNTPLTFAKSVIGKDAESNHSYQYSILPLDENKKISDDITDKYMQVMLLGSVALRPFEFNGVDVSELSGIAWDLDEKILYAVSDEGYLYHLKLLISDNQLKSVEVIFATTLKDRKGYSLSGKYADSEGLSLVNGSNGKKGDSQLIISFENKPRVSYYSPKGKYLHKEKLPKKLKKRKYYRNKNKALESVAYHPKYGVLTASEYPLKESDLKVQTIYSSSGKEWHFSASPDKNSAITGLEVLPDGDVLILERAYSVPWVPIVINLKRLHVDECDKSHYCKTDIIAHFTGADGWQLDNFEGLSHYKDNQYIIVSDDNANILQKTLMLLFEINEKN